ncbi:hypothetical protein LCGC14_0879580 [marine sediment metagenome]|uniref:TonB-dependent receptor n=1 Tax=marine sediment metagenome TaxID=412755 RepID=A0A0F9P2A9_9ZZZZ|nr:TonB-dependent receptor [Methylophaga sp.]
MKISSPYFLSAFLPTVFLFNSLAAEAETQRLETVVVTASTRENDLKTAPASISVISKEELKLRDADDLTDALSSEPGINITSIGQTRRGISIRGMPEEHTLFMLNGQRLSSSNAVIAHSDFELSWLPPSAIERIEVVRGPMSSLYGSDALGGVINVITKVPNKEFSGEISTSLRAIEGEGSDGRTSKSNLYMGGPILEDKLAFTFAGQLYDRNELPLETDPSQSDSESRDAHSGRGSLIWTPVDGQRFDFAFSRSQDDRSRNVAARSDYYQSDDDIDRQHYSLAYKGQWDWGHSDVNIYQSSIERQNTRSSNSTATRPQEVKDKVIDGHIGLPVGERHFLTLGGQIRSETLYDDVAGGSSDSVSANHRSAFVQDEIDILNNLQLVAGLRVDNHEKYGNETSPRLYVVYEPTSNLVVKGGYGQGFRAPSLTELSPDFRVLAAGGLFWAYGNPNLQPELSETYEIGFDYSLEQWSVSANVFQNNLENLVQTQCRSFCGLRGREIRYYENVDEARIRGVELGLMHELSETVTLNANYTYLDTEDLGSGNELERRPQDSGNILLSWMFMPQSTLRWRSEFIGKQYVGDDQYTPAYDLHHIDFSYAVTDQFTVNAGIENLFNDRLQEKSDLYTLAEPGRAFRLGMTVGF